MQLAAFILANMEPILQEWEDFARELGAVSASMDAKALRDHAGKILRELVADLETHQSAAQQKAKSKGGAPELRAEKPDTGAAQHGGDRAVEGFSLEQMVAEYRALRASVLRLWNERPESHEPDAVIAVTRFNEAIDEALAKSVERYARDLKRLMAAARAKERMASLGTLSAGLGHDMNNVLLPMRMSLDELERAALPPEAGPIVDLLRRSVEHLRGLTRGLRSLSVDPEDPEASTGTTELHEWWAEATAPYKWALGRGVQLHAEGLAAPLPSVNIPKHVLMQAVFNLVQNAAEAVSGGERGGHEGRSGGHIWVSARAEENGEIVTLTVRDDGPGMDAETVARCTEPFYTTRHRARGTGLGLALVHNAIERYGGRLAIESRPGEGASFTLILPVAKRKLREGAGAEAGKRRVIVTVREPRVRAMISALLSEMGEEGAEVVEWGAEHGAILWIADDSADAEVVQRFLDEGGVCIVALVGDGEGVLGSTPGVDAGGGADGRIIRIDSTPPYHTLHEALREMMKRGGAGGREKA